MACSGGPKLKHVDDSDEVAALNHLNAAERWGGVRGGAAGATRQGRMENTEGQSGFAYRRWMHEQGQQAADDENGDAFSEKIAAQLIGLLG